MSSAPLLNSDKAVVPEEKGERIADMIERVKNLGWREKLRKESEFSAQVEILSFVIEELKIRSRDLLVADGNLGYLTAFLLLMRSMETLPKDLPIAGMLVSEVESIPGMGPCPDKDDLEALFKGLNDIGRKNIPGAEDSMCTPSEYAYAWSDVHDKEGYSTQKLEARIMASKYEEFIESELSALLETTCGDFPIQRWLVHTMREAVCNYGQGRMFFSFIWGLDGPKEIPWVIIAQMCRDAIDANFATDADFSHCKDVVPFSEIGTKGMPSFTLHLVMLRAAMVAQINDAQTVRSKAIAAMVALVVSIGHFLTSLLMKSWTHPHHG